MLHRHRSIEGVAVSDEAFDEVESAAFMSAAVSDARKLALPLIEALGDEPLMWAGAAIVGQAFQDIVRETIGSASEEDTPQDERDVIMLGIICMTGILQELRETHNRRFRE